MKTLANSALAWLVALALVPAVSMAQEKSALAKQAHEILKTNCYRCHGQDGTVEGGMNYILDLKTLVSRKKVFPGNPAKSKLFQRLVLGDMPPEDEKQRPSEKDIAILKQWIQAGAPDLGSAASAREYITSDKMLRQINADLLNQDEKDCRFIRYFTITHLYNAGVSDDELQTYRNGLAKLLNSLSWGRTITNPHPVDAAKTILRIDLRDLKWNDNIWKSILAVYPYGIIYETKIADYCSSVTGTKLPFIRGDWFVATASQPPLYHHVLQIPKTDRDLEKLVKVDAEENIRRERVLRAGFNGSGISRNNRLIERHESGYGAYWKSYDFASNTSRKNLFEFPLGPGKSEKTFEHDGGEIIFSLPNGMQGYMLVDGDGNRLDKGPITIVTDSKRPDKTVVNGLSCMSCHVKGMIEKSDQIRDHVEKNDVRFKKNERETIFALYPSKDKMAAAIKEDAARFLKALKATGCKEGATEPIVALALRFEGELDLTMAAAEAGLKPEEFKRKVNLSEKLSRTIGSVNVEGGTVQRDVFSAAFKDVVHELELGTPLTVIDLLKIADPKKHSFKGKWNFQGHDLVSTPSAQSVLEIPYPVPEEYTLRLQVVRTGGDDVLVIGLVAGDRRCMVILDAGPTIGFVSGLELIGNASALNNGTGKKGRVFKNGTQSEVVCTVRRESIVVAVDGATMIEFNGKRDRLSLSNDWNTPNQRALFVGAQNSIYRIGLMELSPSWAR